MVVGVGGECCVLEVRGLGEKEEGERGSREEEEQKEEEEEEQKEEEEEQKEEEEEEEKEQKEEEREEGRRVKGRDKEMSKPSSGLRKRKGSTSKKEVSKKEEICEGLISSILCGNAPTFYNIEDFLLFGWIVAFCATYM